LENYLVRQFPENDQRNFVMILYGLLWLVYVCCDIFGMG